MNQKKRYRILLFGVLLLISQQSESQLFGGWVLNSNTATSPPVTSTNCYTGSIFSNLTFTSIRYSVPNAFNVAAVTADNELYMWGRSWAGIISCFPTNVCVPHNTGHGYHTPNNMGDLFAPFKNNVAQVELNEYTAWVLTLDNKLYTWGQLNLKGVGSSSTGYDRTAVEIAVPGGGSWAKIAPIETTLHNDDYFAALTTDGRAYFTGTLGGTTNFNMTQVVYPAGTSGFTYTDIFYADSRLYLMGSDGQLYVCGAVAQLNGYGGTGIASATSYSPTNPNHIKPVTMPAGAGNIVKFIGNNFSQMFLDDLGDIYICGAVGRGTIAAPTEKFAMYDVAIVDQVFNTYLLTHSFKKIDRINGTVGFADMEYISTTDFVYLGENGEAYLAGSQAATAMGLIYFWSPSIMTPTVNTLTSYESFKVHEATGIPFKKLLVNYRSAALTMLLLDSDGRAYGYADSGFGALGHPVGSNMPVPTPIKNGNMDPLNRAPEPI